MLLRAPAARPLRGEIPVPGDKSVTHRALWLGALGRGVTRLGSPNPGADCRGLLEILGQLGCKVAEARSSSGSTQWSIEGRGGSFATPGSVLDFGNSGTAARLGLGALAGASVRAELDGDAPLRRRPMRRVVAPLIEMGAAVSGMPDPDRLPLCVEPAALSGRDHRIAVASAQVKTALLFAGLAAEGVTRVVEPAPSRDHTERLLPHFGVELERQVGGDMQGALAVHGGQTPRAAELNAPGDFSAAAFWIVAATLVAGSDVELPGISLNPLRTGLLSVLSRMGARLEVTASGAEGGDPVGAIRARAADLSATRVTPEEIPSLLDEIPVWAIAAAAANGVSEVTGAAELRTKESDRLALLAAGLRRLGVEVEERPDGLAIQGLGGRPFLGGRIETGGDHRLAMAFLVAGLRTAEALEVTAGEMVDTSYPGFYSSLLNLVSPR